MVSFQLRESGSIRLVVTINSKRFRLSIPNYKIEKSKWITQRVVGKNSVNINKELDRITFHIEQWVNDNPMNVYTDVQIENRIKQIILNTNFTEKRKEIGDYFQDFINKKSVEVNPRTKRLLSSKSIQKYRTAFEKFTSWKPLELEQIDESQYDLFLNYLLKDHAVNTVGNTIKQLKTFFIWCDKKNLPINKEYKFWTPISEETEEETRALNSKQLDTIYNLAIDPVDVYQLAKKLHNKVLDPKQVDQLSSSIEEARRQAVAMASIGAHKEDFWSLSNRNVSGNIVKYKRSKNNIQCVAPFIDNSTFHGREYANMEGSKLFKRMAGKFNYYLTYVKELCGLPFHITAKTFRKTFGSIIWFEFDHPNKMGIIMKAYGHKKETTTRVYLGIQDEDLERDHQELFS